MIFAKLDENFIQNNKYGASMINMFDKKRKLFVCKVLLFMVVLTLSSELSAINLEESLEIALKNNKEFLAEKENLKIAKWNELQSITNFLPKLSFDESIVHIDDKTYDESRQIMSVPVLDSMGMSTGNYIPMSMAEISGGIYRTTFNSNLTIRQPIFNSGKLILGYKIANLSKKECKTLAGEQET